MDNNPPPAVAAPRTPIVTPEPQPRTPLKQESPLFSTSSNLNSPSTPVKQEQPLFSTDSSVNSPPPIRSTPSYESQTSSSTSASKSILSQTVTTSKPVRKYSKVHDIEISVSDPAKVGSVSLIFLLSKLNHSLIR